MDYDSLTYLKNINRKYRLIANGDKLLSNKEYDNAIDYFTQLLNHELFINDYYPYLKLSQAYKNIDDFKSEKEVITNFLKSKRYCTDKLLNYFKNRLGSEIFKNTFDASAMQNKYSLRMPVLSADEIFKVNFTHLTREYKFFKDLMKYDENSSLDFKIKFKYKLIRKGDELLSDYEYLEAIDFFTKLSKHPLFCNDSYPYLMLSKTFKGLNQVRDEKYIILKLFELNLYCDGKTKDYLKNRLNTLGCSKIDLGDLDDDYALSNVPVTSSAIIKDNYKSLNHGISEKTVIELLINEIPDEYKDENDDKFINMDFESDDDSEDILKLTSVDQIDFNERILMINVLNVIKSGKSYSQAAKINSCSSSKIFKWFDDGKERKNINTVYFYLKLLNIDELKRDVKYRSDKYQIVNLYENQYDFTKNRDYTLYDTNINDELLGVLDEFNSYINSSFFTNDIRKYDLSALELEKIKSRILDKILKKEITGINIDFSQILKEVCEKFINFESNLTDDEFDEYFECVDASKYSEDIIFESRIKTIRDYNSNKINKRQIKSRYLYHLKRTLIEKNQLSRLLDIKNNPIMPEVKKYLSDEEKEEIYKKTEMMIKSDLGLKGIVLDYVKYEMELKVNNNKEDALNKLEKVFNENDFKDVDDFKNHLKKLISQNKIKSSDIDTEFIMDFIQSQKK